MSGLFAELLAKNDLEARGGFEVVLEAWKQNLENAGSVVTHASALKYSAVYACVRVLAETLASLPLIIYEKQDRGKRRAQDHYLYSLLHDQPNPMMTAFEFRETLQGHLALWGNAYVQLVYDGRGRVVELWPLRPDRVMQTAWRDGKRWYYYQLPNGGAQWLNSDTVWQLRGLGGDGYDGWSVIALARKGIELGLNAEQFGSSFYLNDARPGIILEHPGHLSEDAQHNLEKSIEENKGARKAWKPKVLEEGMKLHEVGVPPEDAQFLETRQFQIRDIARWFRIQPHKIGDLEQATFSNIEHQSIEFVVDTIRPWAVRWEQSINKNLLLPRERDRFYAEFLVDALLRGDTQSRYQAYAQGRQNGWLSANDIRDLENMNPVDGGDIYLVPLNMVPVSTSGSLTAPARSERAVETISGEKRSATIRHRLRSSYLRIYQDTAARILRREINIVTREGLKTLNSRDSTDFLLWLDDFYSNRGDHAGYIGAQMKPLYSSYGEAISAEAQDEIGAELGMTPELDKFVGDYTGEYSARHVGISKFRLKEALGEAQRTDLDAEEAITQELSTWEDSRSGGIAQEESTKFNNALAKLVYATFGVQRLVSVAFGENCPYCTALNGRVVGINQVFLSAGELFEPDGADGPLSSTSDVSYPPYHGGCDCMIVAGG